MFCPECKETRLAPRTLEPNLTSLECGNCGGHWLQSIQYWRWLDAHGKNLPEKSHHETASLEVCDGEHARMCPECTRILFRCKVGHGLEFYLERCVHCGGIWFDKNEWQVLASRNLHDDVHFVFSKSWQDRLIEDEVREFRDRWFARELGTDGYDTVKQFKSWLQHQNHRSSIIRYLCEDDEEIGHNSSS